MASPDPILTCWKDIATFFGKGVRTVQRWEDLGLPIYRPSHDRKTIFAHPDELRAWALARNSSLSGSLARHLGRDLTISEHNILRLAESILENEKRSSALPHAVK